MAPIFNQSLNSRPNPKLELKTLATKIIFRALLQKSWTVSENMAGMGFGAKAVAWQKTHNEKVQDK